MMMTAQLRHIIIAHHRVATLHHRYLQGCLLSGRAGFQATATRTGPFPNTTSRSATTELRQLQVQKARLIQGASLRWLSSSSSKKSSSQQQQNQWQQSHQEYHDHARRMAIISALVVPITFLGWGLTDWIIGNQQLNKNETLRKEFLHQNTMNDIELQTTPILFHCVVRKIGEGMNHCLTGVEIGDVVEVLEEGVGPDQKYNLCRLPPRRQSQQQQQENSMTNVDVYGWFPTRGLQKLDDYNAMINTVNNTNNNGA